MEFIHEKIKKKPINKKKVLKRIGFGVSCVIAICVLVFGISKKFGMQEQTDAKESLVVDNSTENTENTTEEIDMSLSLSDYQSLQSALYSIGGELNKAVVTIFGEELEEEWAGEVYENTWESAGFILSEDDDYLYILAEYRLIEENTNIKVGFVDGTSAQGILLNKDSNTGLAMLTVEKRLLKTETKQAIAVVKLGNSDSTESGSIVIALGSPLGTNYSILSGNIMSTESKMTLKDKNYSLLATDIVVSRNGSGMLVDINGEVIGIMVQSFSGAEEMGALTTVAVNDVKVTLDALLNGKKIPYIGLYITTMTDEISEQYSIPKGVFIKEVVTESPAMKAGLQSGDVIVKINGTNILTDEEYSKKIEGLISGTTCEIQVKRQNGDEYYDVTCVVEIGVLE